MTKLQETAFQKFLAKLEPALRAMPYRNQLAFGACCCERAFPNYVTFSLLKNWGDQDTLRSGIDEAWQIICGNPTNLEKLAQLESRVDRVTPDYDDFSGIETTAAQEAAFMTTLLLKACQVEDSRLFVRIATFARDTIDLFVQTQLNLSFSDLLLEEKIALHPMMRKELALQESQLAAVAPLQTPSELRHFRDQVIISSRSNVDLSN